MALSLASGLMPSGTGLVACRLPNTPALVLCSGDRLEDQPTNRTSEGEVLTEDQDHYLRRLARKTWSFFETFVTAQDNWLPPDNFQEIPVAKIAHRPSPTNIGLALLANLGARDMGYISDGLLLERTNLTIQSMESMETYKKAFLQLV